MYIGDAPNAMRAGEPGASRGLGRILASCLGLLLVSALAGCGGRSRATGIELTVLLPASERPFWQPLAEQFERDHPGVRVDLVEGPQSTDLREDLYTASLLARDPTFDLVYMDVTWTPKFASAGWLVPLEAEFGAELGHFLPATVDSGIFGPHLYRIPVRSD